MSISYDQYLDQHRRNVLKGFNWLVDNLPDFFKGVDTHAIATQILMHDGSKTSKEEYDAYKEYFYGGNRSFRVVCNFQNAWLHHIHNNPHHWQHWVLINDEPDEGEVALEMPYECIVEMICDWWAFSWQKGDLSEIFSWYDKHQKYIKLASNTRKTVEDILWELRDRLGYNVLAHHGIKGQKWGVRNGPPYPLDKNKAVGLKNAVEQPIIKTTHISREGPPNTIAERTNKNGGVDRTYYDKNGRQSKQVSNHNHGNPKQHDYGENGEHAHDYIYDEDGNLVEKTTRELSEQERKENEDIL